MRAVYVDEEIWQQFELVAKKAFPPAKGERYGQWRREVAEEALRQAMRHWHDWYDR